MGTFAYKEISSLLVNNPYISLPSFSIVCHATPGIENIRTLLGLTAHYTPPEISNLTLLKK